MTHDLDTRSAPTRFDGPGDHGWFRKVLGDFPTGVVIVTATAASGPVGMAIGSFTSVSLDPPLVAFLPDRSSSTFPYIRQAGHFTVNVIAADQADLCRQFARKGANRFAGVAWEPGVSGSPRLAGAVAWLDCKILDVREAGDHFIVVAEVEFLGRAEGLDPLIFFRGGYGRFRSMSLTAMGVGTPQLMHQVELLRPHVDKLAARLDTEAIALTLHEGEILVVASARSADIHGVTTRVGQQIPMVPPLGALLIAWADESVQNAWLNAVSADGAAREAHERILERARERKWSIGLWNDSYAEFDRILNEHSGEDLTGQRRERLLGAARDNLADTELDHLDSTKDIVVRNISAPVFDTNGGVPLVISATKPRRLNPSQLQAELGCVQETAAQMTHELARTEAKPRIGPVSFEDGGPGEPVRL